MLPFHGRGREETCRGIARNVEWRPRGESSVLSFRLEEVDELGEVQGYTSVVARFPEPRDVVTDGDDIETVGRRDRANVLRPRTIRNRRTGTTFQVPGAGYGLKYLLAMVTLPVLGGLAGWLGFLGEDPFAVGLGVLGGIAAVIVLWLGLAALDHRRYG